MKKHYLLLVIAMFAVTAASAAERTWQQKRQIALSILGTQAQTRSAQAGELKLLKEGTGLSVLGYDGGGFAVISNDDSQEAVLGWSDSKFSTDLPDGLEWWLEAADAALSAQADYVREYLPGDIDPSLPAEVAPMIQTVWGQSAPYNLLCPNNYPSGCVATAMSQIMYYHKYPAHSTGVIIDGGVGGVVDLSGITYDWDNMLLDYRNGYTAEEGNAVATLMRYAGVAAYMSYASGGSGTASVNAAVALRDNFSYHENVGFRTRRYHSTDDWMTMVYNELAAGRPILYGAQDALGSGGHAFVFDGYRADGFVHVNWGWDSDGNGYYDIELLNPTMIGSTFEYSEDQDMITGIGLPDDNIEHRSELVCNGNLGASYTGGRLTVNTASLSLYNFNIYAFDGDILIKLTGDNGDYTLETVSFADSPIRMFIRTSTGAQFYGGRFDSNYTTTLPDGLPDGTYTLYLAVRDGGYTETSPMSYAEGAVSFYTLTKSGNSVALEPGYGMITSGIESVTVSAGIDAKASDNRIYSIDGRYVGTDAAQLPKGLYIKGGKKFVKR